MPTDIDLSQLRVVEPVRPVGCISPLRRGEGDVTDPEGDGGFRHAELVGDVLEGQVLGPERAGQFLFAEFASVAHVVMVSNVCSMR